MTRLDEDQSLPAATPVSGVCSAREGSLATTLSSSANSTLDHLLVEAAIQCPEADALTGDFGSLTYAELLIRAQNVAVTLKRRGIGPGHFVGVAMEQTPVMVTAIIGTILAGAAYVPLCGKPLVRRLRANRVDLVLCDGTVGGGSHAEWQGMATVLDASRIEQETMPSSSDIKLLNLAPERPAALLLDAANESDDLFATHRSIARLATSKTIMEINEREMFLLPPATHPRSGLFELWGGLLHGATLALQPAEPMDPPAFAQWVRRHSVTVLCLSVAQLHHYIDHAPELFAKLRYLIIENDGRTGLASPQRIERLQREYPGVRIVNTYATDRTAGYATAFRLPPRYRMQATLPIGQPLEGSQAFILDHSGVAVRAGEIGELALAGDCVGLSNNERANLYLTGERARLRSDGLLELHGHAGSRLQPVANAPKVEAETVKVTAPSQPNEIRTAVIEDKGRDAWQQLVDFVAKGNEQEEPLETEREEELSSAVRSMLHSVEQLPHDTYGDVDRHALRQRRKKENERSLANVRTQQDTLEEIRSLWLRLLRRTSIGYEEDFFEAGGTRVQMIRMHAELNRRFPGAITMAQLSVLRTIHKIYEHLLTHTSSRRAGIAQREA
jgi:acyl-coenzyme A synthetase/AMP-(fatty) acid ligase